MKVIETLNKTQIHELHAFYQQQWWTKGRTLADTESCVKGSQICLGLVDEDGVLQGFTRVLTDYTFKALIFDLIVSDRYRNKGLGSKLMSLIKNHPNLRNVKHFELYCLPEMFAFYQKHGFSSDVGEIRLMRLTKK